MKIQLTAQEIAGLPGRYTARACYDQLRCPAVTGRPLESHEVRQLVVLTERIREWVDSLPAEYELETVYLQEWVENLKDELGLDPDMFNWGMVHNIVLQPGRVMREEKSTVLTVLWQQKTEA